jgi:hypothetical protein
MKKNYSIAELKKLLKRKSLSVMFQPYGFSVVYQATNLSKHDTKEWEGDCGVDYSGWAFETEDTDINKEIHPVEFVWNITIQQPISLKLTK